MNVETFIISYDLAGNGDYNALIEEIKSYRTWAHLTESTWAIVTDKTSKEIRDQLKDYLSEGSRLIVIKSAHIAAWLNVICSNEWIKNNL
jgi:hypothetical protein